MVRKLIREFVVQRFLGNKLLKWGSVAAAKTKDEVKGRLLLDIVVRESSAVFKLLSSKDEALLVWGDAFLVLDLGLNVLDGVRRLNIKGDGLASQGLDEDLHTTA